MNLESCIILVFVAIVILQAITAAALELVNRAHIKKRGDYIPDVFEGLIDENSLRKIKAYTLENSSFAIVTDVFSNILILIIAFSGILNNFDSFGITLTHNYVISGLIFFYVTGITFYLIELPFDYYHTFVIEEKHGFNRTDVKTWIFDNIKGLLLSAIILAIIFGPLLFTISTFPNLWWLYGFIIVSLIQFGLVVLYPIIIAPLFNKFEPVADLELARKVNELAHKVGMTPKGVFQMDAGKRSGHSNAYFTGIGKTKRIVLFDTLLAANTHDEILAVLAHELGHFKLKHVMKSYIVSLAVSLAGFYIVYRLMNWPPIYSAFYIPQTSSYIAFLLTLVFLQKLSYFLQPLKSVISRKFERESDDFAAKIIDADYLISALKKLAFENLSNLHPHRLYSKFYYSHPPVTERIRVLQERSGGAS